MLWITFSASASVTSAAGMVVAQRPSASAIPQMSCFVIDSSRLRMKRTQFTPSRRHNVTARAAAIRENRTMLAAYLF
ncbi:MAG TPA: hypothetical protein VGJ82_07005, partial [Thermoanaerobaculia bacterium]